MQFFLWGHPIEQSCKKVLRKKFVSFGFVVQDRKESFNYKHLYMNDQLNYETKKILKFSQIGFIQSMVKGIKIGTFRKNRNGKYKIGDECILYYERVKGEHVAHIRCGSVKIKNIVKARIFPELKCLEIVDGVMISVVHARSVLNAIAVVDGFKDWRCMVEYFEVSFDGSWIIFDEESFKWENDIHLLE